MTERRGATFRKPGGSYRFLTLAASWLPALLFALMTRDLSPDERGVSLRFLLFILSGVAAFVPPYFGFPDPNSSLFQLGNLRSDRLFTEFMHRLKPFGMTGGLLIAAVTLSGLIGPGEEGSAAGSGPGVAGSVPGSLLQLTQGNFFWGGISLLASSLLLQTGERSGKLEEGSRGDRLRLLFSQLYRYPVDPGAVPTLLATIRIALTGMAAVVAGAGMGALAGVAGEMAVALLLFLYGLRSVLRLRKEADRHYYRTNAFFREFFAERGGGMERDPLRIEQLWWIPSRWKVHSWALLLQSDRRLPAGRLIAAGHLLLWTLAWMEAAPPLLLGSWILFALLHQALLGLTVKPDIAPSWWLRLLDRPVHWVLVRFWMQVRWLFPLLLSMGAAGWLFGLFSWKDLIMTASLYLLSALLVSLFLSLRHEMVRT